MILYCLSLAAMLLALIGCAHLTAAAVLARRFARQRPAPMPAAAPGVTLLKPLQGAEPGLYENLLSFCRQDYPGALQIVFGVADANDAAVEVVEHLRKTLSGRNILLVVDATVHGSNQKVSNLINMATRIAHEVVIVADSDIRVGPHYLARVIAALAEPGTGAATCLYHGVALDGLGSRLFTLAVDAHFLPNLFVGLWLGMARPCFGSTIAMRREVLDEIGGFAAVADTLADDYAIGAAVRARGHAIAIPPFVVAHTSGPMRLRELWRHELRWARTIRAIALWGHAGSLITHPLPWSVLALGLGAPSGLVWPALVLMIAAGVGRIALLHRVARSFGFTPQSYWLVPARDLFSFTVFVASFFGRSVSWRGGRFLVQADGTLLSQEDSRTP